MILSLLAHTVRETSFRTNTSYIDNLLMPLIDNPNQLSAKVLDIAAQFESSNIGQIKVGSCKRY